jgi:hypothetical protein
MSVEHALKDPEAAPEAPAATGAVRSVQDGCRYKIGDQLIIGPLQNGMQSRFVPGSGMQIVSVNLAEQTLIATDGTAHITLPWSCIEHKPNALPRITVRCDVVTPPATQHQLHPVFLPGTEALVTSERTDSPLFTKGSVVIVFRYDPSRTDGRTLHAEWNGVTDWINPDHLTPHKPETKTE